jgi:hypothetical protein
MLRRSLLLVLIVVSVFSCRRGKTGGQPAGMANKKVSAIVKPLPQGFFDRSAIGSDLAKDGTVLAQKTSFVQREPVYVTMRFFESPAGLQASLRILDEKGKELHREAKQMNGEKIVTFKLPPSIIASPGSYSVIGYWGGNDACDYKFDVRGKGRRSGQ